MFYVFVGMFLAVIVIVLIATAYFQFLLTSEGRVAWQIPDYPKEFIILQYLPFSVGFFFDEGNEGFKKCEYSNCRWTNQKSDLFRSSAVLFHLSLSFGNRNPPMRHPKQKWIAHTQESPANEGVPGAWTSLFNSTATYVRRSNVWTPYGIFSRKPPDQPVQGNKSAIATKTKMVAWMVSRCNAHSKRELYVKELQKYIDVDVYGLCGNLTCSRRYETSCREMVEQNYKFYLAFENSLCEDYVTEKLFQTLKHYIVPVVMAGADLKNLAPPNSYIDAIKFSTPEKLANFLLEVAANETKYLSYFEWKESYTILGKSLLCGLCEYLNKNWNKTEVLDMKTFWRADLQCVPGQKFVTYHYNFNQTSIL